MVMYCMNSQVILRQASHTYFSSQSSNFNSGCEIKNIFIQALYIYPQYRVNARIILLSGLDFGKDRGLSNK